MDGTTNGRICAAAWLHGELNGIVFVFMEILGRLLGNLDIMPAGNAVKNFSKGNDWAEFYAESVPLHSLGSAIRSNECATPGIAEHGI